METIDRGTGELFEARPELPGMPERPTLAGWENINGYPVQHVQLSFSGGIELTAAAPGHHEIASRLRLGKPLRLVVEVGVDRRGLAVKRDRDGEIDRVVGQVTAVVSRVDLA